MLHCNVIRLPIGWCNNCEKRPRGWPISLYDLRLGLEVRCGVIAANARQVKLISQSSRKKVVAQILARLARVDLDSLRPTRGRHPPPYLQSGSKSSTAQRGSRAVFPLLQKPWPNLGEFRMLLHMGTNLFRSLQNRFVDTLQNLSDLCWATATPCFAKFPKCFCDRPLGRTVEGQRQAVFAQIQRCRHEIVDGGKSCFSQNVVIDDPKIFQMRVAVAKRAVCASRVKSFSISSLDHVEFANCPKRLMTEVS